MPTPVSKEAVIASLDTLPEDAIQEVATFIEFLKFKAELKHPRATPYRPIRLGGLAEGPGLDENELREIRREMWQTFGDEL